jgi:hypothetical protein
VQRCVEAMLMRAVSRTGAVVAALAVAAGVLVATDRVGFGSDRAGERPARIASGSPGVRERHAAVVDLTPRRLEVTTDPPGAQVRLVREDGSATTGRTPYRQVLPGGRLRLTLERPGYNRLSESLVLDRDRRVHRWMDPAGLLHYKIGVVRTGPAPKQVAFTPDGREIWVSLLGGHGLEVFGTAPLRRRAEIRLGVHGAVEVIFSRDGRTVYASQMETASVFEIDRRSHRVHRQLSPGASGARSWRCPGTSGRCMWRTGSATTCPRSTCGRVGYGA